MTPYLIISTRNAYQQSGVHTMVFNHTIKTNLQDCISWINLMNNVQGFTDCEKTYESKDGKLITYNAKFTTQEGERGWIEYEIWQEPDITM